MKKQKLGGGKLKKIIIWVVVVVFFIAVAISSSETIYDDKVREDYYELLIVISELFKDHTQAEEQYYNHSYSNEEEIANLLNDKVTDRGFRQLVESLFEEHNELFVYKQEFQKYLKETLDFSIKQKEVNYYDTVSNTILNPALRLINFDQLRIEQSDNRITIIGEDIEVKFYDDSDERKKYHQYARFGFPSKAYISLTLTFIYEDNNNRLDEFEVRSYEM